MAVEGPAVEAGPARLGLSTLHTLPAGARPRIPPGAVAAGIVHLGLGAFHRAHQAVYTEDAIAAAGGDWGIIGVAPRSRAVLDPLAAQDRLYSVLSVAPGRTQARVLGVHVGLLHAVDDPDAVVAALADPAIRVVTLTVTEKAYRLDPVTGAPLAGDELLRADLAGFRPAGFRPAGSGGPVRTLPGLLVRGLLTRAARGGAPLTVISCDNLPSNGCRLAALVRAGFALAPGGPAALDWLDAAVTFPASTVDRIVPAATAGTRALAGRLLGVADLVPVCAEPFHQWVIEDRFAADRPAWERAGAVLTADVQPYERLKLRVLNGVHSALAYLGALAGCDTIDSALALPGMAAFLDRFLRTDVLPTLVAPPGIDLAGYGRQVLERFANPALGHRTHQVAMDGSQKLPQRLFGTLADCRAAGAHPADGALVLAAWLRFVRGYADDGRILPLDDPLAAPLRAAVAGAADTPAGLVDAVFALPAVVDDRLTGDDELRALVVARLSELYRGGVTGALS